MQFATFSEHGQANQSPHDFANHVNISCHGNIGLPPGRVVKLTLTAALSAPFSTANTIYTRIVHIWSETRFGAKACTVSCVISWLRYALSLSCKGHSVIYIYIYSLTQDTYTYTLLPPHTDPSSHTLLPPHTDLPSHALPLTVRHLRHAAAGELGRSRWEE